MRFTPRSKEELERENLIEPGQYSFEIVEAQDTQSKAGNDMIKLKMKIFTNDGKERILFDYLLEALSFKLRHFCETTGLIHKYESGAFTADDCVGKCGVVDIIVDDGKGTQYGPSNKVKDYVLKLNASMPKSQTPAKKDEPIFDELSDLPF